MKKILIIEDDKKLAGGIMLALRKEYACSMAHSLASARKDFDVTQFDLILLDVNFPDGNGMDYLVEKRCSGYYAYRQLYGNGYCIRTGTGSQ